MHNRTATRSHLCPLPSYSQSSTHTTTIHLYPSPPISTETQAQTTANNQSHTTTARQNTTTHAYSCAVRGRHDDSLTRLYISPLSGHCSSALVSGGCNGYLANATGLSKPISEWQVCTGQALLFAFMNVRACECVWGCLRDDWIELS